MTHPWPTDPHEKSLLLRRLKDKYWRLFGSRHLEEDMIEIRTPPKPIITNIASGQYHIQKIQADQRPPKTPQQLKIEAQYERRRSD